MRKPRQELVTISSLFKEGISLRVPVYQRFYEWNVSDAVQFLEDYFDFIELNYDPEAMDADEQIHFLGAVYLAKDETADGDIFDIVDGQQRITTLLLLINAVKRAFRHILKTSNNNLDIKVKLELSKQINKLDSFIYKDKSKVLKNASDWTFSTPENLKLEVWEDEKDKFFKSINTVHPSTMLKYSKTIRKFREMLLHQYTDTESFEKGFGGNPKKWFDRYVKPLFSRIQILKVELQNMDDAYSTFERLNDRGVKLTVFELLNIKLLKILKNNEDNQKSYADYRKKIVKESKLIGMKPQKILLNHFTVKYGKISEKDIPAEYAKKLDTFDKVKSEFDEILKVIEIYKSTFGEKKQSDDTVFSGSNNYVEQYKLLNTPFFKYPIAYMKHMTNDFDAVNQFAKSAIRESWNANINSTSLGARYGKDVSRFVINAIKNNGDVIENKIDNQVNGEVINRTISNRSLIKYLIFFDEIQDGTYKPIEIASAEIIFPDDAETRISTIKEVVIKGAPKPFNLESFLNKLPLISENFE